ncbi:MAG: hypothetical protein L3J11_03475 [Draconibacterium sp.]|nr:hypothetical protein [Draconibacterium sp.]
MKYFFIMLLFATLISFPFCQLSFGSRQVLMEKLDFEIDPRQTADSIAKAFGELTIDVSPEKLYTLYNRFCLTHYGAEIDPLVYGTFGDQLIEKKSSNWEYISEKSASIAWKTNLPAKSYIQYGLTTSYGRQTDVSERFFYVHLHYLKNLEANSLYHYKCISVDERGNKMESEDRTFQNVNFPNAIHISGDLGEPPYLLDLPNSVYVVTEDIIADHTAFEIKANNITLDLGGHTIVHGNQLINDLDHELLQKSGVGIRRKGSSKQSGIRIFNGTLKQGVAENNTKYYAAKKMVHPDEARKKILKKNMNQGLSNIEFSFCGNVEIAGVTAEYRWNQTWGMRFENAYGKYNIHHNICLDKGTQMFSRHGAGGARSIGFIGFAQRDINSEDNEFDIHHNLIKRTRQNGLNVAQRIYENEIYVDSWVVNSFAISPYGQRAQVYGNQIFLTGYYACGILWATRDLNVHHNFIHMESISTMIKRPYKGRRLIEDWGEQDVLAGLRLTNYDKGGQQRENLSYSNNVIFGRCRGDVEMRGTEFFSDYSIRNLVCQGNIIKIIAEDTLVRKAACVDTQGAYNDRSKHLPIYYKNCSLISNRCNVRFGDEYGQGSNHQFINCKIIKVGNHPDYHTFEFDGHSSVFNHVFLDCDFMGGASYDDVYWTNTQSLSNYRINWTLNLESSPGAKIWIIDNKGQKTFSGVVKKEGRISVPLTQSIIRPVEWTPDGKEIEVNRKLKFQEETFNPYVIELEKDGKKKTRTINMNEETTLEIKL